MNITAKNKVCMIIGDPVKHSLSPTMHNAAYQALGIDDQFVFVASQVNIEDMETVIKGVRAMNILGLTCTIPHKIEVIKYLDEIDPIAQKIGAVNTVVNENGTLKGYNTDWLGTVIPLEKMTEIKGKKAAVIGAGGVGRAIAYGLKEKGADLIIFDIAQDLANNLANEVEATAKSLDEISEVQNVDIIINATPLGMEPHEDKSPIPADFLHKDQIAFDAVYIPYETKFLREAKEKGAKIIHRLEMLLYQGTAQFEYYTNQKAPEDVMKQTLMEHFKIA